MFSLSQKVGLFNEIVVAFNRFTNKKESAKRLKNKEITTRVSPTEKLTKIDIMISCPA